MRKIFVSPSILSSDFSKLDAECKSLEKCGADWIHCDIMDGVFVPNITIGMVVIQSIRKCVVLPLDVHLMIVQPERYVEQFAKAGADIITFHVEATRNVKALCDKIHSLGKKVGIALKPSTPVNVLKKYKGLFDLILVMTVEPGFGGQKLIDSCVEKVSTAREMFPDALIEVDGGVNDETAKMLIEKGANVLVAGHAVFSAQDRSSAIKSIRGEVL